MEVHFTPDVQAKLEQVPRESGCRSEEVIEDALTGYFDELRYKREMLDRRYADLESGKVTPTDGEAFFERLRLRDEEPSIKPSAR